MYKEMIICVVLVVIIIIGDYISQKYTKNTVEFLLDKSKILKEALIDESDNKINEQIDTIRNKWLDVHDKLACYIEHDELEKVETNFTACVSLSESKEYSQAISELDKMNYVLEHIENKYSFNLVNIF